MVMHRWRLLRTCMPRSAAIMRSLKSSRCSSPADTTTSSCLSTCGTSMPLITLTTQDAKDAMHSWECTDQQAAVCELKPAKHRFGLHTSTG